MGLDIQDFKVSNKILSFPFKVLNAKVKIVDTLKIAKVLNHLSQVFLTSESLTRIDRTVIISFSHLYLVTPVD